MPAPAELATRVRRRTDLSVQVHACHGTARQVDVLREVLVGLLEDDPTLEPRDILVMCPDIETYAPLISAGFGLADVAREDVGHPAHRLRVRLADRSPGAYEKLVANEVDYVPLEEMKGRIGATLALIYPPGIGVLVPGERWDDQAQPMLDYFMAFQESFNRFPGFNYEVQGVYQERIDDRIKFFTYAVQR